MHPLIQNIEKESKREKELPSFRVGDVIEVESKPLIVGEQALAPFECAAFLDGELVATATIYVHRGALPE